jgi:hypothetical protein
MLQNECQLKEAFPLDLILILKPQTTIVIKIPKIGVKLYFWLIENDMIAS